MTEQGGRLRKPVPGSIHGRSVSAQTPSSSHAVHSPTLSNDQQSSYTLNDISTGPLSPLMPPPPVLGGVGSHSRSSSADWSSRPGTPGTPGSGRLSRPTTPSLQVTQAPSRGNSPSGQGNTRDVRKSWFGGGTGKLRKEGKTEERRPVAWVAGHPEHPPYNLDDLVDARPVKEVWDNVEGNCFVYLFPRASGKGPSFKVSSAIFASSPILTRLAFGELYSNDAARNGAERSGLPPELSLNDITLTDFAPSPPSQPEPQAAPESADVHLYLPIKLNNDSHVPTAPSTAPQRGREGNIKDPGMEDLQTLIDIRNFFAFLCGQSLVATEKRSSFFSIFMNVSGILKTYEFSNLDGSTYGEIASGSFDTYVEELSLADVRSSREKTIEGIVLGERMKSVLLYNEAFTHSVGKHEDIVAMKSSKFGAISPISQNRLYRAAFDLEKRTASIRLILEDFEFPALFTGIAASKVSSERKEGVRFDPWKEGFARMRKHVMAFLKQKYGNWPPKAKSKKNDLEISGLNRLVLRDLYHCICTVYDLLVDRTTLTTRTVDGKDLAGDREEANIRALRTILSEYDRSSPPVKPPVPFDLPKLPTAPGSTSRSTFNILDKKRDTKKLKDDEIAKILRSSWNDDAIITPFLDMYREMEKRAAHGCTLSELTDQRIGHWIFLYVVLQALPMLACDAPALKWTQGVEYFLCEPPRSGVPWADPTSSRASAVAGAGAGMQWFTVENNGGGVVSLPSDILVHSVEGIYRRSHAWTAAERWSAANPSLNTALHVQEAEAAAALEDDEEAEEDAGSASASYSAASASANSHSHSHSLSLGYNSNNNNNSRSVSTPVHLSSDPMSAPSLLSIPSGPPSRSPSPGGAPYALRQPFASAAQKRHSSLGFGLEALPLPAGVSPDGRHRFGDYSPAGSRSASPTGFDAVAAAAARPRSFHPGAGPATPPVVVDKAKTFDAILANVGGGGAGGAEEKERGRKRGGAGGGKKK